MKIRCSVIRGGGKPLFFAAQGRPRGRRGREWLHAPFRGNAGPDRVRWALVSLRSEVEAAARSPQLAGSSVVGFGARRGRTGGEKSNLTTVFGSGVRAV
jgi:hypothetical protein